MAIEKYVSTSWQIERVFDSQTKIADFTPSTYVPPEIQAYVDRLKAIADPRFTYVHVIAMTDGDYYGSNLNGDIFTTDQLTGQQTPTEAEKNPGDMAGVALPRYKTFEQAKFFRNHANGNNDPAYGDVPCAAWNDLMRRVELVVRIAKKAIPELGLRDGADICAKLDRRGYLTLSMGTRITHEKCRYCGAENEYIHQRCDHLKNHMNEIMPDGRLVSAENFGCRFFDISDVGVPADPAAYSLSKVASAVLLNHAIDVPGDGYAPWRNKLSEMEKRVLAADPVYDVPSDDVPCSVVDGECTDEFTEPELKAAYVAAHGDLSAVVSTAAAAGMVFSPRELATLTA
ncbi:MAG: hypothetical protein SGJ01_13625, partial [Gemmatimonadota bacterium]|nr:hypothetical protein [Gemmatimonadota bacterium]